MLVSLLMDFTGIIARAVFSLEEDKNSIILPHVAYFRNNSHRTGYGSQEHLAVAYL